MTKKKEKSASRLFIILLFFVVITGTTGFALFHFRLLNKDVKPEQGFKYIHTRVEVVSFIKKAMPEAYTALENLDIETGVIKKELDRLDKMAKTYPQQTKIISSEKKNWEKIQKELATALSKLENEAEAIYVSYMVNPEKGMKRVEDSKTSELLLEVNNVIASSQEKTARLKIIVKKTFIENIKEKLFNSS